MSDDKDTTHKPSSPATRRTTIARRDKTVSFEATMQQARSHMSRRQQLFSSVIHSRPIELISDIVSMTVARPNVLLFGAISACVLSLTTYYIAKDVGYSLSGAESLVAFAFGWAVGLVVDYVTLLVTGGNAKKR